MNKTYRQLADIIEKMDEEQKDMNATVYVEGYDEFYPIKDVTISEDSLVDIGHPVMNTPEE